MKAMSSNPPRRFVVAALMCAWSWTPTLALQSPCVPSFSDDFSDGVIGAAYSTTSSCGSPVESGGELHFDKPACIGGMSLRLAHPDSLCGDFDVQVDFELPHFPTPAIGSRWAGLQIRRTSNDAAVATVERYSRELGDFNPSTQNYKAYTASSLNSASSMIATTDFSGKLRISRQGVQLRMQFWNGATWTLLRNEAGTTDPVYMRLFTATDLEPTSHKITFDNLSVTNENSGVALCFGDGSGVSCPCAATGSPGHGCPNTNPNGNGARLRGRGTAYLGADDFALSITDGPFSRPGILVQGGMALNFPNGNPGVPNASGIFCVSPALRGEIFFTDGTGFRDVSVFQGQDFGATAQPPGSSTYYQFWYRDPGNGCQNAPGLESAFNFSNAWVVGWAP